MMLAPKPSNSFVELLAVSLPTYSPSPIPVTVVNSAPDTLSSFVLIFTLIAAAAAIPATVAGVVAAIYAFKAYRTATARAKLFIPMESVTVGTGVTSGAFEMDIGISIQNEGATTEGVYVDLWLEQPDPLSKRLAFIVDMRRNPDWLQCDSKTRYEAGEIITWTRWSRYYRQHIPGNGGLVELDPFRVAVPATDGGYDVLYRLRSADGLTLSDRRIPWQHSLRDRNSTTGAVNEIG